VFESVRTQWQHGFNGPTNLNYCAVYPLLDRIADDQDDWWALFNDLRVLEAGALNAMAARRDD
jgi:hypothetical protein